MSFASLHPSLFAIAKGFYHFIVARSLLVSGSHPNSTDFVFLGEFMSQYLTKIKYGEIGLDVRDG